jgi:putative transposase
MIFHCLNRGNDRRELFADNGDYAAFERVLASTLEAVPVRLLAYCLMPNHWHLLLWLSTLHPSERTQPNPFLCRHTKLFHLPRVTEGCG